ncbi:hypothetical protein C8R47DRAFT_1077115 [Mycena vitilis]|nr:hypothetical protein C8R47DRAFT_1077115 [Mycena vitilis]
MHPLVANGMQHLQTQVLQRIADFEAQLGHSLNMAERDYLKSQMPHYLRGEAVWPPYHKNPEELQEEKAQVRRARAEAVQLAQYEARLARSQDGNRNPEPVLPSPAAMQLVLPPLRKLSPPPAKPKLTPEEKAYKLKVWLAGLDAAGRAKARIDNRSLEEIQRSIAVREHLDVLLVEEKRIKKEELDARAAMHHAISGS